MQQLDVEQRARAVLGAIASDPELARFVDFSLDPPGVLRGSGEIRLIVLGQDPTVKNPRSRARITTVLDLDRRGSLRTYLARVCEELGLDLDRHVYATNYLKGFFVEPPTRIEEIDAFQVFGPLWLPLLRDELAQLFSGIPVISLGEPLLNMLVCEGASPYVRDYWGYTPDWKSGKADPFRYLEPDENRLGRTVFPFPHQRSVRKQFYRGQMSNYTAFIRDTAF
jgi:hypothetical protein